MINDKVSIAMANYNCGKYIAEAIDSILSQTYGNWELIIVDDCSTDNSLEIISQYKDDRINLICSKKNEGLAISLNKAFKAATGSYIARLDPDDIALPNRFEKQLEFFENNDRVVICGSNVIQFGEVDNYITKLPQESNRLMAYIPFCSPLPHSSWMISLKRFGQVPYYSESFRSSQDYELMHRLWKNKLEIACISEPLVKYRVRNDSISNTNKKHRDENTKRVQGEVLRHMGLSISEDDINALNFDYDSVRGNFKGLKQFIGTAKDILKVNKNDVFFSQAQFRKNVCKYFVVYALRVIGL